VNLALEEVGLDRWRRAKSQELSGGMRRRLSIALAIVAG